MQNIIIIDTETTGLDPSNGQVVEVAAILYNVPSRSIIAQMSTLLYAEDNKASDINKISVEALKSVNAVMQQTNILALKVMMNQADAVIAHNAQFDHKWLLTIPDLQEVTQNKKWICTKDDVSWNLRKGAALNLVAICVELNIPIINAHRALSDCSMLLQAIETRADIEEFLDKSGKGKELYHAVINFEMRQLAKDEGFIWDNMNKVWTAKLTPEQVAMLPFKVIKVQNQQTS